MEAHGDGAYSKPAERAGKLFAEGDHKSAKLYALAQNEIAKRSEFPYGLDTATRYLEAPALPPQRPPELDLIKYDHR